MRVRLRMGVRFTVRAVGLGFKRQDKTRLRRCGGLGVGTGLGLGLGIGKVGSIKTIRLTSEMYFNTQPMKK